MNVFSEIPEGGLKVDSFLEIPHLLLRLAFASFGPLAEGASKSERLRYKAKYFFNRIQLLGIFWTLASKFVLVFHTEDKAAVAKLKLDVVTYIHNEIKVFYFVLVKDKLWKILEDMKPIFDDQVKRKRNSRVMKYFIEYRRMMLIYGFPLSGVLFINLLPIIPYLLYGKMKLLIVYWYPFDPYQVEIFPFIYLWVNWLMFTVYEFLVSSDLIFYGLITILVMEFNVLKDDLLNISEVADENRKETMRELIDRHQTLLDISERVQAIYSPTSLSSFVISSITLGFAAFLLSGSHENLMLYSFLIFYIAMMSATTLLLCFFGQKLIDASGSVAEGAYNCGWENSTDIAFRKQLILIMIRSQRVNKLSAMGFADISLETFARVIAATGSYFSLLKSA